MAAMARGREELGARGRERHQMMAPTVDWDVVQRLMRLRSDAPVLSFYVGIPVDPGEIRSIESRFRSLIRPVRELTDSEEEGLSHGARQSLRADIDKILAVPTRGTRTFGKGTLGKGIAIFACAQEGLYEEVVMPRALRDRAVVDTSPYLRPLLAVLDESRRYCVVVVDREQAWLYEFWMGQLEEEERRHDEAVRKRDYGGWRGWDEHGTQNRADHLTRKHLHDTAEAVEDFMSHRSAELLVVGGHQETVAKLVPFLSRRLQPKVAGTFAIDPSTMSAGKVREMADEVVNRFEREEERRLVTDALDRAAGGGRGAVGLPACLRAAGEHAIDLLLVQDETVATGRVCGSCGWLDLEGDTCPLCAGGTRATSDVIEEMAAVVIDTGGRVEHVFAETDLADHLVAATLRFKLPEGTPSG